MFTITKKILILTFILLVSLSAQSKAQTVMTESEIKTQSLMVAEISYLREANKTLLSQREVLDNTIKTQETVLSLKDKQIQILLEVIANYEVLKGMYSSQIEFQQKIIDNSNKIIESQQKLKKSGNFLDTLKSVLYAMLGVVVARVVN